MRGYSQLLLNRIARGVLGTSNSETEMLRNIHQETIAMSNLVADLLDVARLNVDHLAIEAEVSDIIAIVHEAVRQCHEAHPAHRVVVLSSDDIAVSGLVDRYRLKQVVTNLLDNAAKYSDPGRPITIRTTIEGSYDQRKVHIAVQDEGIGIPPEDVPNLFQPYFRATNVGRNRTGLGLGLYLAAQFIGKMGGTIWVDSIEGAGSTFHVTLPSLQPGQEVDLIPGR
jgi:signal transduction histidine kinase